MFIIIALFSFSKTPQRINYPIRSLGIKVVHSTCVRRLICIMMTKYYPTDVKQFRSHNYTRKGKGQKITHSRWLRNRLMVVHNVGRIYII